MGIPEPAEILYDINTSTYDWSVRVFRTLKKLLGLHIHFHYSKTDLEHADILLFNHFARLETFIPQYLIYEETGAYCCSVATKELFEGDEVLANFLRNVGAVRNDYPRLLPLLAEQVIRGRKIIIFPEGGMVKDRRVIDQFGEYSVFSRTAMDRRKLHSGAAALALGVDIFKRAIRHAYARGDQERLERWTQALQMKDTGTLLATALRPTLIVPSNITFYPIRINDNLLRKGAELLDSGLTRRHSEELLIEGNILLKETDMDIRLGNPIDVSGQWGWRNRNRLTRLIGRVETMDDAFSIPLKGWRKRSLVKAVRRQAQAIRNQYMHAMYAIVTINLSHLASTLIMESIKQGKTQISRTDLHQSLYLAVKQVQKITTIHLHHSLQNPEIYEGLIHGHNEGLEQFIYMAESSGLIEPCEDCYRFLPKLSAEYDFDEIRTENLVSVYANEVAPLRAIGQICRKMLAAIGEVSRRQLATCRFDDQLLAWRWDKARFDKPSMAAINRQERAIQNPRPFLLHPPYESPYGILLAHGFLASPAEVAGFASKLVHHGYTVIGVRLKGHGTSPWDLRQRSWEDWFQSMVQGYEILQAYTDKNFLVGFSTGGALALRLAADQPDELLGVAAVSVPVRFRDSGMMFVPLVHGTNRLMGWFSSSEGKSFIKNTPEHPDVNYQHIPVRGLYELRRLVNDLETRLPDVHCPTLIVQGDEDPTVDPKSAGIIYEKIGSNDKKLLTIHSNRHGILMENTENTQEKIMAFLDSCAYGPKEEQKQPLSFVRAIEQFLGM